MDWLRVASAAVLIGVASAGACSAERKVPAPPFVLDKDSKDCGAEVEDQAVPGGDIAVRTCLLDAHQDGKRAALVSTRFTEEGDVLYFMLEVGSTPAPVVLEVDQLVSTDGTRQRVTHLCSSLAEDREEDTLWLMVSGCEPGPERQRL